MKSYLFFLGLGAVSGASAADWAAWTHRQTVPIAQPGLTRLVLDPALLDASRTTSGAAFHDLRVISPAGVETPYVVALPRTVQPEYLQAKAFKVALNPMSTVLVFEPPTGDAISEVLLQTDATDFIKAGTLEASRDGANWETLANNELLCRQHGTERLRFSVAPKTWTHFRATISDQRTGPIAFTGAQIRRDLPERRTVPHPVTMRDRREMNNETHLTLDLGTANVMLGQVRLQIPEPVFQRRAALLSASATLFRLQHEGLSTEELDISAHQLATSRDIELVISNGDSPPLRIESITATRHEVPIVFQADAAGEWQFFMGNAQAAEPVYDIAALSDKLRDAAANAATARTVEANAAFRKTATAPDVGDVGAALDVSAWSFQRSVHFGEVGVIELELDPAVLAQAATDLHDVRVVREGRQIPFLVITSDAWREIALPITPLADPKAPQWSKWEVALPLPNFPVKELQLQSPTPLFVRTLSVSEQVSNAQGHFERILGGAHWQRKPGQANEPVLVSLDSPPNTSVIRISSDNGDNAPLLLSAVRARYPSVRLLFRVSDTAPVQICYGNAHANHVAYDLQLVRQEFESATKVAATLGEETKLSGFHAEPVIRSSGSPWLWAALALVVAALLWIVAKMLPQQQA